MPTRQQTGGDALGCWVSNCRALAHTRAQPPFFIFLLCPRLLSERPQKRAAGAERRVHRRPQLGPRSRRGRTRLGAGPRRTSYLKAAGELGTQGLVLGQLLLGPVKAGFGTQLAHICLQVIVLQRNIEHTSGPRSHRETHRAELHARPGRGLPASKRQRSPTRRAA